MKMTYDHDFHIHSQLSLCSNDPLQSPEAILQYARDNDLKKICLTDHHWDKDVPFPNDWYAPQDYDHLARALPLPQDEGIEFHFGCEAEMDRFFRLSVAQDHFDRFDFIIVSTTHLHWYDFTLSKEYYSSLEGIREIYVERLRSLLHMDLPFHKMGIAHLTCDLIAGVGENNRELTHQIISGIPDDVFREIFTKAAQVGIGIELNTPVEVMSPEIREADMRPYRIAKECGCRFYFGSDSHHPSDFLSMSERFRLLIDLLDLQEQDRFDPFVRKQ